MLGRASGASFGGRTTGEVLCEEGLSWKPCFVSIGGEGKSRWSAVTPVG